LDEARPAARFTGPAVADREPAELRPVPADHRCPEPLGLRGEDLVRDVEPRVDGMRDLPAGAQGGGALALAGARYDLVVGGIARRRDLLLHQQGQVLRPKTELLVQAD